MYSITKIIIIKRQNFSDYLVKIMFLPFKFLFCFKYIILFSLENNNPALSSYKMYTSDPTYHHKTFLKTFFNRKKKRGIFSNFNLADYTI